MTDLIAQGTHAGERWRRTLPLGVDPSPIVIGRTGAGVWAVPWDDRISREHVTLQVRSDGSLTVRQMPSARNPIFYRGQKRDEFVLAPGEHFVIGKTTFTLAIRPAVNVSDASRELTEHVYEIPPAGSKRWDDCRTSSAAAAAMKNCWSASSAC